MDLQFWSVCVAALFLGFLFITAIAWMLLKREEKLSAPMVALATLACTVILFGLIQPEEFKFAGFESIKRRLSNIEKNLRPYAIIDPKKKEPINQTFLKGAFQYRGFSRAVGVDGTVVVRFWMRERPAYLEVRSNGGKKFKIREAKESDGGVEYLAELEGFSYEQHDKDPYQIIIEAFFENQT